jgi:hypothetical protein
LPVGVLLWNKADADGWQLSRRFHASADQDLMKRTLEVGRWSVWAIDLATDSAREDTPPVEAIGSAAVDSEREFW